MLQAVVGYEGGVRLIRLRALHLASGERLDDGRDDYANTMAGLIEVKSQSFTIGARRLHASVSGAGPVFRESGG